MGGADDSAAWKYAGCPIRRLLAKGGIHRENPRQVINAIPPFAMRLQRMGHPAIVSKDSDFAERSVLESSPPKIVWIRLGNCSTAEVESLLRSAHETVRVFIEEDEERLSP